MRIVRLFLVLCAWFLAAPSPSQSTPTSSPEDGGAEAVRLYNHAGDLLYVHGDSASATAAFQASIRLKPDLWQAHLNLGVIFMSAGENEAAMQNFQRARDCAQGPEGATAALTNLGILLHSTAALGDSASIRTALQYFEEAATLSPLDPVSLYNFGKALMDLGDLAAARAKFERALEYDPGYASVRLDLANIYHVLGEKDRAVSQQRAVADNTAASLIERVIALNNMGMIYRELYRHDESLAAHTRALKLDPSDPLTLLNVATVRRVMCDWKGLSSLDASVIADATARIADGRPPIVRPFDAFLMPRASGRLQLALATAHANAWSAVVPMTGVDGPPLRSSHQRPLSVGYMAFDFRTHPTTHLMQGLVRAHNRSRVSVELLTYGPDDGSRHRHRILGNADGVAELRDLGDAEASEIVAERRLHVLVDVMGHTRGARLGLAALKPAPIVACYLAFPGSTGAPWVDYHLLDSVVVPPETTHSHFSERVVYLPHTYQGATDYPMATARCVGVTGARGRECAAEARRGPRFDAAAVDDAVFCNFNNIHKMDPDAFGVWMDVLRRSPGSVLVLLEPPMPFGEGVVRRLRAEANARGVDARRRLVFLPRAPKDEHLSRMRMCDAFLDNFVYGAHTTTTDALWGGVPVVTIASELMPARVASSLLRAAGFPQLSTRSRKEFESLAIDVVGGRLPAIRHRMARENLRQPLFRTHVYASAMEAASRLMWELHAMGRSPMHIVVEPRRVAPGKMTRPEIEDARSALRDTAAPGGVVNTTAGLVAIANRILASWG